MGDCIQTAQRIGINYGDGPIKGNIAFTDILIDRQIPIKNQSFSLIDFSDGNMRGTPGIFGIGPPALAENPNPQPLEHMIILGHINHYMFSLYLGVQKQDSVIVFGGYDTKYMKNKSAPIIYTKIVSKNSYTVEISGFSIFGKKVETTRALIDSGTTCLTFPDFLILFVVDVMRDANINCEFLEEDGAPQYSILNCRGDLKNYPNLTIHFNDNQELTLYPRDYIFYCEASSRDEDPLCYTKIESSKYDEKIILGDGFLQSFYTIFDFENKQIGFTQSISNHSIHIYTQDKSLQK